MKKFTKEEIEGTREYFQAEGFPEVKATIGTRAFSYFVVPQSKEPNLKHFIIRLTGEPHEGYVFGIADSVNPDYRQYAVAHEFIEFTEIGIDTPHRCTQALEEELKLIPKTIKKGYIQMRRDFFRDLIQYCAKKPQFYSEDDLHQFRHNLERLEELVT